MNKLHESVTQTKNHERASPLSEEIMKKQTNIESLNNSDQEKVYCLSFGTKKIYGYKDEDSKKNSDCDEDDESFDLSTDELDENGRQDIIVVQNI